MSVPYGTPDHNPETRTIWLAETDAAHHLGIVPRSLRRWIAEGKVPAYRAPSGRLRFKLEDLDACMTPVPNGAAR